MIGKYHSHTLPTKPRHREEESHNNNSQNQSNQFSLPHQDDCKPMKGTKHCACTTNYGTITELHN